MSTRKEYCDAEIEILSIENPELTNVLPLEPGVGENIATHASPIAEDFFPVLILIDISGPFTFISFKSSFYFLTAI